MPPKYTPIRYQVHRIDWLPFAKQNRGIMLLEMPDIPVLFNKQVARITQELVEQKSDKKGFQFPEKIVQIHNDWDDEGDLFYKIGGVTMFQSYLILKNKLY